MLRVIGVNQRLRESTLADLIIETVPTWCSILIHFDSSRVEPRPFVESLESFFIEASDDEEIPLRSRLVTLPVLYGGEVGPDLEFVAKVNGVPLHEAIRRLSEGTHFVGMISFISGQANCMWLEPEMVLATPKYETPRTMTPEGTVGLGGSSVALYSVPSPGGFQMVGRLPVPVYSPYPLLAEFELTPILLRVGDRLRLRAIERTEYDDILQSVREGRYRFDIQEEDDLRLGAGADGRCNGSHRSKKPRFEHDSPGPRQARVHRVRHTARWCRGSLPHRLANAMVGNQAGAATLEMMLIGASFEVLQTTTIAWTGPVTPVRVNGAEAPTGKPLQVSPGDTVSFGKAAVGCFGYVAFAGGLDGVTALGSRSTYIPGRLGGHFGRALRSGDVLKTVEAPHDAVPWSPPDRFVEWPRHSQVLRFVRGPQSEYFTERGYRTFTSEPYEVSPRSNRIAYRLRGPAPAEKERTADTGSGATDIVEDGNLVGAIQMAGGVEPICMGRDCPSTGAYAKIGCLISVDVCRLAQLQPGDVARFEEVSVEEAHRVAKDVRRMVAQFGRLGP